MKKEKEDETGKRLTFPPLLWIQALLCPGPCHARVEIASMLSFRKCSGMRGEIKG